MQLYTLTSVVLSSVGLSLNSLFRKRQEFMVRKTVD